MSDLELIRLDLDTGFSYDARGRMLLSNEPRTTARKPAPRLVLGRTLAGDDLRVGAEVPDSVARELEAVVESLPRLGRLDGPPPTLPAVREALERLAPITSEYSGPTYHFPASITRSGEAIQITSANVELARDTYPWLLTSVNDWWPCFGVVHDGAVVSVCFTARLSGQAAAAGVDTLRDFRQRGYAAAATAAWGAAIRASGRIPFYSTGWDNLASQGVARRVGLITHGSTTSWR